MPSDSDSNAWLDHAAYVWTANGVRQIAQIDAPGFGLLRGIEEQKKVVRENIRRLANGIAAHDMLLWGARGMGKSALVRAGAKAVQEHEGMHLALVQTSADRLEDLPILFDELHGVARRFLVYIDDLGFADDDLLGPRQLRSWLEGGVEARPGNVRLAVTSNRRAIVSRQQSEQDDPLNPRDVVDDKLALADRFGIVLGFHACDQATYLGIVDGYAQHYGLDWEEDDALLWARQRGTRSGRTAWQYVTELAGRAGQSL